MVDTGGYKKHEIWNLRRHPGLPQKTLNVQITKLQTNHENKNRELSTSLLIKCLRILDKCNSREFNKEWLNFKNA